jgi:RNA polymerase sigma-70 factor (ECF subfamily)
MSEAGTQREGLSSLAEAGDPAAWGEILMSHQERLRRMVTFRLDPRLRGRIDPADVVQEAFAAAAEHRSDYFRQITTPLFLWLRGLVANKLRELHRHHLGTRMRDAGREAPSRLSAPDATSVAIVDRLIAGAQGPGTAAAGAEVGVRLHHALDQMDSTDREVLALRHFEQLTNAEAAQSLGIQERAAAKRYVRALKRLKDMLAKMPGGLTVLRP